MSDWLEEQGAVQVRWSEKVSQRRWHLNWNLHHSKSVLTSIYQLGRNRHSENIQTKNIAFTSIYSNNLYLPVKFLYFPYKFSALLVKIGLRYLIIFCCGMVVVVVMMVMENEICFLFNFQNCYYRYIGQLYISYIYHYLTTWLKFC